MTRILYLYRDSPYARFIRDDLEILRERYVVDDLHMEGKAGTFARILWSAARADLVYFWWGDVTGLVGAALAALRGKPSVMITGGYDVADVPEIRYGLRYHPWRRFLPPVVLRLATEIVANAEFSGDGVVRDFSVDRGRVHVVYHGVDAARIPFGPGPRAPSVLTCSLITGEYIPYKGLDTFVRAAALLPEVPFVHVGATKEEDAFARLKAMAPPNVHFRGFVSEAELLAEMGRAAVYAQLSAHEGFGVALAEAMLAGATPVVTRAGAIPEVAGPVAQYVDYGDVEGTAAAIRRALAHPRAEEARARIIEQFPLARRREGVLAVVERALAGRR